MSRYRLILLAGILTLGSISARDPDPDGRPRRDNGIRSISGEVRLSTGAPASGAVVKLKDLKTLAVRSCLVAADGKYRFQNLPANVDYEVRADASGMAPAKKTVSVFDSRPNVVVNLKLEPAKK